jgi:hypothetical protein
VWTLLSPFSPSIFSPKANQSRDREGAVGFALWMSPASG